MWRRGRVHRPDVLTETVHAPVITVNSTPAAVFRSITEEPPTLLVDEADTLFGTPKMAEKNAEKNEEMRGLLNAGHQRGRYMLRVIGNDHTPHRFPTFAMATLAGIGELPDTVMDRSIVIRMRRRADGERVSPYRTRRDGPRRRAIRDRVAAWARPLTAHALRLEPQMPVEDRYAIIGLGLAGCALSYDALVQMALAAHIRPPLTYLFPIVIDGFIAYGVRALLVLRTAPVRPRLSGWTLFIAATTASIWANCRHAINLNQPGTTAVRLDDTTVAILSAIAPLALAGATHLHLLINRHSHPPVPPTAAASPSIPPTRPAHPQPANRRSPFGRPRPKQTGPTAPAAAPMPPSRTSPAPSPPPTPTPTTSPAPWPAPPSRPPAFLPATTASRKPSTTSTPPASPQGN